MTFQEADQAAVIPVRPQADGVQICLIRRRGARRWGIPKGYIDNGDTPAQAALTEAREEAGLTGRIEEDAVGTYEYGKWGGRLTVAVYVMAVIDVLPIWEEMDLRERQWMTVAEAGRRLRRHPVWPLWETIRGRL